MSRYNRRVASVLWLIVGLCLIALLSFNIDVAHSFLVKHVLRPTPPPVVEPEPTPIEVEEGPRMVGGSLTSPLPNHDVIIAAEKAMPQHDLDAPYPGGKKGRYVRFSNQVRALGWNNVLNEVLLCSHLAWRSKRAYVFEDYLWQVEHYPWRIPEYPWPQTPLNALIAGPTAGGPWEPGDDTPRSIRADHFPIVCPDEDTDKIYSQAAKEPTRGTDGKYVLEHFLRLINESPKRCVEIVPENDKDGWPQTFDLWTISTPLILPLWPQFRDSPVSRLLRPSPLVESAVKRNEHLFFSRESQSLPNAYEAVMAIHLRRRDYINACKGFSEWSSTFYQWNLLPELPDSFPVPEGGNTPENAALYARRCFPTEEQILEKIQKSKIDWETGGNGTWSRRKLKSLYVMTNEEDSWKDTFRPLMLSAGWEIVVFGSDLALNAEQIEVGMAVDMDIGRQAAVFIGNGWSSMTSNVVHRRLVDGHLPASTRFW